MGGERSSGLACSSCSLHFAPMSSTAAWLQSTNTPACGSSNQTASKVRSKRLSNTPPVCVRKGSDALVLSSQSRSVADEFMMFSETDYSTMDDLHQLLKRAAVRGDRLGRTRCRLMNL